MRSPYLLSNPSSLQKAIPFAALLNLVLVAYGVIHFPTSLEPGWLNDLGLVGVVLILAAYGLAGRFGVGTIQRADVRILRAAVLFGALAGLFFAGETLLEYIVMPRDNSVYGLVEYGLAFVLYLFAAIFTALQTGRVTHGVLAGVISAMIASLIWYAATLFVFYLFNGTRSNPWYFEPRATTRISRAAG